MQKKIKYPFHSKAKRSTSLGIDFLKKKLESVNKNLD